MSKGNKSNYFENRDIDKNFYDQFKMPKYILDILSSNKKAKILDIGCGFGQHLEALNQLGYKNIFGIDISQRAIQQCKKNKLNVQKIDDLNKYLTKASDKFDFIIMSHVLEHIKKEEIISTLKNIKNYALSSKGSILIAAPNAQSNTGCYWAFEDFTHHTLFTGGSLTYVLRSAGFENIKIIDKYGTAEFSLIKKKVIITLLWLYCQNKIFWNKVTNSSYHQPSPEIYTFEIKILAN